MKAITLKDFGGPEMMALSEVEQPVPGEGELLVRVHNSSVNRPDVIQRQGNYPPPPGDSEILGLEVAGVVLREQEMKRRVIFPNFKGN